MKYLKLSNGVQMPMLGFGTYQIAPQETKRCVKDAIEVGYRSIDTAQAYMNEKEVGDAVAEAIKEGKAERKDIFITTKIWISNSGEERAYQSILESIEKLQTEYIDLLLIHQPFGDYYGSYRAMQRAYKEGKVRAIGVSNFYPDRFVDLANNVEIKPMVNQVETHVFNQQIEPQKIMHKYGTATMSWGPFVEGKNGFFTNSKLKSIGDKYNKSIPQVTLKWLIQRNVIAIPKSLHIERMKQNFDIFDFELTAEDMALIATLDGKQSLFIDHHSPETVEFLSSLKI